MADADRSACATKPPLLSIPISGKISRSRKPFPSERQRNGPFFGRDALRRVRFEPVQSAGGEGFDRVFSIAAVCNAEIVYEGKRTTPGEDNNNR